MKVHRLNLRSEVQMLWQEWMDIRARRRLSPNYTGYPSPHLLTMGRNSYGEPIVLSMHGTDSTVTVGTFCSIADGVTFLLGMTHHTDWITTCPNILGRKAPSHPAQRGNIVVGHDVWIGRNVTILEGVRIGTGAVIGAGAVVAKDVPPYSIAVGVPAEPRGSHPHRFDKATCEALLESEWWTLTDDKVRLLLPSLWSSDVEGFLQQVDEVRQNPS